MIDQRHVAVERERDRRGIDGHQRAVAAPHPPVDLGVFVLVHVEDRDPVEFAAVDVSRDRIDHWVPAIAGFEIAAGGAVAAAFRGLLGAVIERVQRFDEVGAFLQRKGGIKTLLAPRWAGLVDFEIQPFGDLDEGILVRRMQPAAAEVEGDIGRGHDGVGAAADAVARFQHDCRETGIFQRPRGAEAGGARTDDGDIDFGGEGHAVSANGEWRIERRLYGSSTRYSLLPIRPLTPPLTLRLPWPFPRACGRWRRGTSCAAGSTSGSPRPVRRPRYRPAPFPGSSGSAASGVPLRPWRWCGCW